MSKAYQAIQQKRKEILYKKVGKRYVPATDPYAYEGLRKGWWLVNVDEGSTSIRQCLWPDKAEVQAAFQIAEEKLVEILRKATEARPRNRAITPEFKKDWDKMIKKHGSEMNYLEYDSLWGIAQTILKEVQKLK